MTNGEFIKIIENMAIEYRKEWTAQLARDYHMNELKKISGINVDYQDRHSLKEFEDWIKQKIPQEVFDALIVDFINYIAANHCGIDFGMYSRDLSGPNWRKQYEN